MHSAKFSLPTKELTPSLFLLPPTSYLVICSTLKVSTIMHDVSTCSTPQNIHELFIHSPDVHAYNMRFLGAGNLFVQKSRLHMKLKSFPAFGRRLWNCLLPDWHKLMKGAFKRKIHKLLLTVLKIEDYYVDAHSLILNLTTRIEFN